MGILSTDGFILHQHLNQKPRIMKWVKAQEGSANEGYELWADDKKLAGISFSPLGPIARLVSNIGKRLFFFEKKGFLAPRAILKNEYGISMGKVEEEKRGSKKGWLEMDGKKYYYVLSDDNNGELKVYDEGMKKSLLTCSFNAVMSGFNKTRSLLDTQFPRLLLVLCWYAFQPHTPMTSRIAV
jgi:hypothetical protein